MSEEYLRTEVKAIARYVPISPQKVRLVADQIRGEDVEESMEKLRFMPQRAAESVAKVLRSAVANAEENYALDPEDMVIAQITVDEGPRLRRARYGARGRFKPIRKRLSHITVVLEEDIEDWESEA